MKRYQVVFNDDKDSGVYALSCVESPAMQDEWIRLKQEELRFSAIDEEKRILLGAALIPNKDILRTNPETGEAFHIFFDEKTIEKTAHEFIKNGFQGNSTVDHEVKLEGVSVVETWIVEDPESDKSKTFGKTYPKGTWVAMMKVYDDKTWQDAKEGKINGFSIDGLFGLKEINLKSETMADEKVANSIFEKLKTLLKKDEVKLGQIKLKDGETILEFEGEAPEVGKPIFLLTEDKENRVRAPKGSHETETGEMIHVDANGLVAEDVKEEAKDEVSEEVEVAMKKIAQEIRQEFETKLADQKKDYEAKLSAAHKENKDLKEKLEKEPASTGIVKTELKAIEEPKTAKERLYNVALNAISKN